MTCGRYQKLREKEMYQVRCVVRDKMSVAPRFVISRWCFLVYHLWKTRDFVFLHIIIMRWWTSSALFFSPSCAPPSVFLQLKLAAWILELQTQGAMCWLPSVGICTSSTCGAWSLAEFSQHLAWFSTSFQATAKEHCPEFLYLFRHAAWP